MTAIGIDVGGTNVRSAVVAADGTVRRQQRDATPDLGLTPATRVARLASVIGELVARLDTDDATLPVGVGIAGAVDDDGVLVFGPNLGIEGHQVRAPIEEAVGRTVAFVNDASAATWAEHRVGGGAGLDDVVLLTLGTGVGGGAVVGGVLLEGAHGIAGEFGHTIVREGGARCPCGRRGCLEAYAAGARFALDDRPGSDVVVAAGQGDERARAHLDGVARWLGVGIANAVASFDPAVVLIGGGAGQKVFDGIADVLRVTLDELLVGSGHRPAPPIRAATLGDDAGVVGAALLALDRAATTEGTGP